MKVAGLPVRAERGVPRRSRGPSKPTRSPAHKAFGLAFLATLHGLPVIALVRGTTSADWLAFGILYLEASFAVGAGLHRYFSHRAFRTSRAFQGLLGMMAGTMFTDPIGFAGKHRLHHRHADSDLDVHSPGQGLWFCWVESLVDDGYTDEELMAMTPDLNRLPEMLWLRRWFPVPAIALGALVWLVGGFPMFAIGFCLSRVAVLNSACAVNYFCHRFGNRSYETRDDSRNNAIVALLTLGEGWHNNHHHYPAAAKAGFRPWQLDIVYLMIKLVSWTGLIWDVRDVPQRVLDGDRLSRRRAAA